ncbi:MAG: mevalonate kinase [Nitrososphaeraceae archaeon]|jgi:mevalonate kinase
MSELSTTSIASAPAKIILFGEHFVVYNNPAILISISKRIEVHARLISKKGIHVLSDLQEPLHYTSLGDKSEEFERIRNSPLYPICDAVLGTISNRICEAGIEIRIKSDIPVGVGLGSSGASCVATVAAVENLFKVPNREAICSKAMKSESLIHKGSSGADCFASTFGGVIYYVKNHGFDKINFLKEPHLLLLSTGLKHSTGSMISKVENFRSQNESKFRELCKSASEICNKGRAAIRSGHEEEIGSLMNENHKLLQTIGVSHEKVDELVEICNKNGALGSKLTGAGGGGYVIALVKKRDSYKVTSEVMKHNYEVFPVMTDSRGLEIR